MTHRTIPTALGPRAHAGAETTKNAAQRLGQNGSGQKVWSALVLSAGLIFTSAGAGAAQNAAEKNIGKLLLPPGFDIALVTTAVPNARQMALSDSGVLYVGTRKAGNVYAVTGWQESKDSTGFSAPTKVRTIASDLSMPSGLVWHDGSLFVGALDRVLRWDNIDDHLDLPGDPEVISDSLPDKQHHGWKYLSIGPDNALYVPVGAPCNICLSKDPRFASILRMDPKTGETSIYAAGVRNTVGMAWHPDSKQMYFSDNGRDRLGEDIPAEEINRVTTAGAHYGYPYIHAGSIPDPEFGEGHKAADYQPPLLQIQAHSAALGLDFYTATGDQAFPERYKNALFIAEHGSWNRKEKVGYRISVMFETAQGPQYAPFITGWLQEQANWGRPSDVLMTPNGDLLISDDQTGSIYRVSYATGGFGGLGGE